MANKQTYLPFFYDWIEPFSTMSGDECKALLLAMLEYHQSGKMPPQLSGMAKIAAMFIFPQIDRAKEVSAKRAEIGATGGKANRSKREQNEPTNTNTNTSTNTNTNTSTNTNTNTITNTDACTEAADTEPIDTADTADEDRFAVFWERYPRKQNKVKARAAWDKLSPDNELLEQMLTALDRQIQSSAWQTECGRYIPSPISWLTQRRWEDEETSLPAVSGKESGSFSTDEFFQAALRRSMMLFEAEAQGVP